VRLCRFATTKTPRTLLRPGVEHGTLKAGCGFSITVTLKDVTQIESGNDSTQ
jgi:hypothetical protein